MNLQSDRICFFSYSWKHGWRWIFNCTWFPKRTNSLDISVSNWLKLCFIFVYFGRYLSSQCWQIWWRKWASTHEHGVTHVTHDAVAWREDCRKNRIFQWTMNPFCHNTKFQFWLWAKHVFHVNAHLILFSFVYINAPIVIIRSVHITMFQNTPII